MSMYDLGAVIIAVRAALPTNRLQVFEETLYRAAMSPHASNDLREAIGLKPRSAPRFHVVPGNNNVVEFNPGELQR